MNKDLQRIEEIATEICNLTLLDLSRKNSLRKNIMKTILNSIECNNNDSSFEKELRQNIEWKY